MLEAIKTKDIVMNEKQTSTLLSILSEAMVVCDSVKEEDGMHIIEGDDIARFVGIPYEEIQLIAKATVDNVRSWHGDYVHPCQYRSAIFDAADKLYARHEITISTVGCISEVALEKAKVEALIMAVKHELTKEEYWPGYRIRTRLEDVPYTGITLAFRAETIESATKIGGKFDGDRVR